MSLNPGALRTPPRLRWRLVLGGATGATWGYWTNGQRICLTKVQEDFPSITVRDATIAGLESIKEGKGCWVALYQRATREIQNSLSL